MSVPSQTDPDTEYVVLINPWGDVREDICDCEGYRFRGQCSHQPMARQLNCGWTELEFHAEKQLPSQRRAMICPRCSEDTMWEFLDERDND